MNDNKPAGYDYNTHILIGCTSDGKMTMICHWPQLPRQAEVEQANASTSGAKFIRRMSGTRSSCWMRSVSGEMMRMAASALPA